jgi:hypothetical protein
MCARLEGARCSGRAAPWEVDGGKGHPVGRGQSTPHPNPAETRAAQSIRNGLSMPILRRLPALYGATPRRASCKPPTRVEGKGQLGQRAVLGFREGEWRGLHCRAGVLSALPPLQPVHLCMRGPVAR